MFQLEFDKIRSKDYRSILPVPSCCLSPMEKTHQKDLQRGTATRNPYRVKLKIAKNFSLNVENLTDLSHE